MASNKQVSAHAPRSAGGCPLADLDTQVFSMYVAAPVLWGFGFMVLIIVYDSIFSPLLVYQLSLF